MPKAKAPTKKVGRPKVEIDWAQVGKLLEAGATAEGIAATLGVSTDTLYNRCKSDLNSDFSAFSQQKKAKGDELLRVAQFKQALGGNTSMLIWLGKQRLSQTDKSQQEIGNKDGEAFKTQNADLSGLSVDELLALKQIKSKVNG